MKQTSAPKLHALTTLRFFAAAMIVFHHSADLWGFPHEVGGRYHLSLAVSFFFALSGFILTYVYPNLESWEERGRFLLARIARIWPAHLAAFGLLWLLLQRPANFPTGNASVPLALLNLSLLHGWIPIWTVFFSFNPVSWTISTEFFFYLAFLLLNRNWRATWWWKLPLTLALAVGAIALCVVLHLPDGGAHPWEPIATGVLYINPVARVFEFALGMCVALLFERTVGRVRISTLAGTLMEVAAVGVVVLNMFYRNNIVDWFTLRFPNWPVASWVSVGPCCCFSFIVLIYVMALHAGYLSRILGTPLGVLLGEISYSVYLTHYVLITFYRLHEKAFATWPAWESYLLFWAVVLLTSWVVWAGIERPLRAWIVSRWPKRQKQKAPSAAPPVTAPRFSLLQPRWPAVLAGIAVLLLAVYPAYRAIAHANAAEIQGMRASSLPDSRDVRFGAQLQLLAATVSKQGDGGGGLELALAWETIGKIPPGAVVAVHLVDDAGKILAQRDYALNPTVSRPSPVPWLSVVDPFWVDRVQIPATMLKGVTHVAIAVYHKKGGVEEVDRGPRDWDNRRLLLTLPQ